jgi:hypothetical protein
VTGRASDAAFGPRFQRSGVWKGRGCIKVRWRTPTEADRLAAPAPTYFRLHRRNPLDHKVIRIGRLEVWW